MEHAEYKPEEYWNSVALNIERRNKNNVIAGDEEPYYLYKREKFLNLLHGLPLKNKRILETGCGPGGNLVEVVKDGPRELVGVDISEEMIRIAKKNLSGKAEIKKINGCDLPFASDYFDIVFTSTVLQHITDEVMLDRLVAEMCRVSSKDIYTFERVERNRKEIISNIGRTVEEYSSLFESKSFVLQDVKFVKIYWSWLVCGAIRKIFNPKGRKEAQKETGIAKLLQRIALVITRPLDKLFPVKKDLAMLHFQKSTIQ